MPYRRRTTTLVPEDRSYGGHFGRAFDERICCRHTAHCGGATTNRPANCAANEIIIIRFIIYTAILDSFCALYPVTFPDSLVAALGTAGMIKECLFFLLSKITQVPIIHDDSWSSHVSGHELAEVFGTPGCVPS